MALPLVAPLIGLGKGLLGGLAGLGKKAAVTTAVKSVAKKGKEEVKTKISPSRLPSISPRYYEKPKEAKKSTSKTSGGSVNSVKMTAESIKSSLLNQDKLLKTLKSDNAKIEKQELERQKREQAVKKIKSGLKSIGSKLTSPIKSVTRGIGTAIPLLIAGILVNSLGGIISGVRNYYDENIKPKVDFVNKKVEQFNNFIANFGSQKNKLDNQRKQIDGEVDKLKSNMSESEINSNVKKINDALDKGKFSKLSDKEKDEFILKKSKLINPEIKSLSKDTSDMISSLPFDTNINMDTSNMYDEDLIDEDSSQIFIVNRPYVVKG